jgi:hypothetical protein
MAMQVRNARARWAPRRAPLWLHSSAAREGEHSGAALRLGLALCNFGV